jgi:hypothetical protein
MTQPYLRANTDWLAACRYGLGVHWTAQTQPRSGPALPFAEAVAAFDREAFVESVTQCGADYVIFTTTHALQMLACPHPVVERLLPGRTSPRDLLGELAEALAARDIALIFYYNHSCNHGEDSAWEQAVGYHAPDKSVFAQNLADIVGWMGERYGELLKAWWFDSSYSVDDRGPSNTVTTDLAGFQFPWEHYTQAAKRGFPQRLVTYNAGVNRTFLYTTHQDYWAGELVNLDTPATSRTLESGLQWQGWTCLDDRAWVHTRPETEAPECLYPDAQVVEFVRACNAHQAPIAFNVIIYQDGTLNPHALRQLQVLRREIKGE